MYKPTPGIYADPTVDFAFKRIFGTEQYKAATIGFLNSVICPPHPIMNVEFINVEVPGLVEADRKSVVDVICTSDDGSTFVVEMQNFTHSYFRERMIVYGSSIVTHLAEKGSRWNFRLKPIHVIAILNDRLSYPKAHCPDAECYYTHYVTMDRVSGTMMPSAPQYHFFELSRFTKKRGELCDPMEKWLFLLKESKFFREIPEEFSDGDDFKSYFRAARTASFSKDERMQYDKDMLTQTDIDIIREEGHAEGRVEGRAENSKEIATKMKALGLPEATIAECTGLSLEEISAL